MFDHEMEVLGCNRYIVDINLIRCTFDITNFEADAARGYVCYARIQAVNLEVVLSDVQLLTLEVDRQPRPAQTSAEADRSRKNSANVFGGVAPVVAIAVGLFCLCICRGCCSVSENDEVLVTKSTPSTFRHPPSVVSSMESVATIVSFDM